MYTLIENFCLGVRRLELFGRARTLRRGWVTVLADGENELVSQVTEQALADRRDNVGPPENSAQDFRPESAVRWNKEDWDAKVQALAQGGKPVVPMTPGIDFRLRIVLFIYVTDCCPQRSTLYGQNLPCVE